MHKNHHLTTILEGYREAAQHNRNLGDRFERLIKRYLLADKQYDFESVWLWGEWRGRDGQDVGIDLVAQEAGTGEYWAIQCKFYTPGSRIPPKEIDSFLAASGQTFKSDGRLTHFSKRLLVTTSENLSTNSERKIANQSIPVAKLTLNDLYESPIDWSRVDDTTEAESPLPLRSERTPRPDQQDAIDAVVEGMADGGRGKLIMACGTGKTYV